MAKRKRQIITDTRSNNCLYYTLDIAGNGVFSRIPLDHVGFDPYILEQLTSHRITQLGQIISQSPLSLRRKRYLQDCVLEMMDSLDVYFCNAFEEGRKAYYSNPVPIYKLIRFGDIDCCRNYLLYDLNAGMRRFAVEFSALRAHGIITVYEFLKMNLVTYHELVDASDVEVRRMLISLRDSLYYMSPQRMLPMSCPLDEHETEVISYPLPAKAVYKVAALTDDRIAGDEVSTEGLTPYEKALYDRSKDAIDLCGADFYYDVADNRDMFECFAKSLAVFWPAALELMQRKEMLRNLYMAVPERYRKMPARALYHYMVPRIRNTHGISVYCIYAVSAREVRFLKSWDKFHLDGRMASLEDAYRQLEETVGACSTVGDFDKLMDEDGDWQFQDLLCWLANVSMLNAVHDNFLRRYQSDAHEATEEMKGLVPGTDPDEVIAGFARLNSGRKKDASNVFNYYAAWSEFSSFTLRDRCTDYRYDFFGVYMLLTGKTSVPFKLVRSILHPDDVSALKNYLLEKSGYLYLYEYNPDTDMVTMKENAFE